MGSSIYSTEDDTTCMDRRKYLAVVGTIGIAGIAGCSEEGGDEEPEPVDGDDEDSQDDDGGTDSVEDGDADGDANGDTDGDSDGGNETEDGEGDESGDGGEEPERVEAVIGELIESDDMQLVVENFERGVEWEYFEPEEGNEFATVSVALKNISSEFLNVNNLLQTRIKDDENYSYTQTFLGGDEPTFNDGQFAPGEVERGAINFELPVDASGLKLVWDFDIGLLEGIDRVTVDLENETSIHTLEQNLQIEVYDVGTTIEFKDTQVTVNDVRVEEQLGTYAEPDEGNEYVVVDISIENQTGEERYISTFLQMLVKDGDGYSYQEDFTATSQLDKPFVEGTPLADGETRRGEVVYEVEEGLSPLYWVFEFSLWTDGDKTFWELR